MFFRVQDLEVRKAVFHLAFQPGEVEFMDGHLSQAGPLEAEGTAELSQNLPGEIRVQGRLKVTMNSDCDRCLEPSQFPLETRFDLLYEPARVGLRPAEEVEIGEDDTDIAFYEGDGLELKDILREQILLALPMQRVCREDCRGICPECGQNRNVENCECQAKAGDDRWAALKELQLKGI